jgi:hypothetical protein
LLSPATARTGQTSYLGKRATKQQNGPRRAGFRGPSLVIAGGLREIKNIHSAGPTTAPAGIGAITTDAEAVTQEHQLRQSIVDMHTRLSGFTSDALPALLQ